MKTCPYCAEEIQDAAIKCRYCQSWLVDEVPASAETPPAATATEPTPEPIASERTPKPIASEPTAEPEPTAAEETSPAEEAEVSAPAEQPVEEPASSDAPLPTVVAPAVSEPASAGPVTPPDAAPVAVTPPPAVEPPKPEPKVEFTHSGERYLLGYTDDAFGIWDRQSPATPMERFPRTDDGWRQVWQRYAAIERNWMDLRTGQRSP